MMESVSGYHKICTPNFDMELDVLILSGRWKVEVEVGGSRLFSPHAF